MIRQASFPPLPCQLHPFQRKHVSCYFVLFFTFPLFSLYSVFLLQVNICFLFFSVWKWMDSQFCLADKKSQLMTTAVSAVSIRNLDSIFTLFLSSWLVAHECRDKMRGSSSMKNVSAYEAKLPFLTKKKILKKEDKTDCHSWLDIVCWVCHIN